MITGLFVTISVALFIVLWVVYDVVVAGWLRPRYGYETETQFIQRVSHRILAIPFFTGLVVGLVGGHLFLT